MELNFSPKGSHFRNAIDGAVGQACIATIAKFRDNGIKKLFPLSRKRKIIAVFTDCEGNFSEDYITELSFDGEKVTVSGEGHSATFDEKGGDGYIIIEPVIGEIYEAVHDICSEGEWLCGERW